MKKFTNYLVMPLFVLSLNIFGQFVNVNPDPSGEPWISGDAGPTPPEIVATIPNMVLTPESDSADLDYIVDNSELIYMPPVFNQTPSASCVQVAEIWYAFGYEVNRIRNVCAGDALDTLTNLYHPYYTYNFLNYGTKDSLTNYTSGFDILKENGCPSYDKYNDTALSSYTTRFIYWMNEYENYYSGMQNKVDSIKYITWDDSYESLNLLKHWLNDHNSGDTTGGLAIMGVYQWGMQIGAFLPGTPQELEHYVYNWGNSYPHTFTIIGYHDSVQCFDINGDNEYTNEDFDGDSIIELSECELGAFKVVNSYGEGFADSGYIYVPYRLMGEGLDSNMIDKAYVCYVSDNYEPQLTIKSSVEYPCRENLLYMSGYAVSAAEVNPKTCYSYEIFKKQGGVNDMRGAYEGPIESALDIGYKFIDKDFGKIFFLVRELDDDSSMYDGTVHSFSLIDYRWNEEFELQCLNTNIPIVDNGSTILTIDYDLIPHEDPITTTDTLFSDMVSRFNPQVSNGATLLVEKGVNIDMYNSDITIKAESTLTLEDSITITAKRDTCRIVIDGEINIGKHINFVAEDSALLEIRLNNGKLITTFDSVNFERCKIFNNGKELTIKNSDFNDCQQIYSGYGKVTIDKCDLTKTGIHLLNPEEEDFLTTISNCDLITENTGTLPGIRLHDCNRFLISNNTIRGYFTGIDIRFSGTDQYTDKKVWDNTIDSCSFNGISTYYSTVKIEGNDIQKNLRGISFFNNSTTEVTGDEGATSNEETQQISNNSSYELYSSLGCFPWSIQFNVIHDSDNGSTNDPIVYTEINPGQLIPDTFDIRYNCWDTSFDSINDLKPSFPFYLIKPKHCPGSKKSTSAQTAEPLYRTGLDQFADEQYSKAQSTFKQVVEQFPGSAYSLSAMKSMFDVEEFVDNDYYTLQDYYLTNTSVVSDSSMKTLGIFLANRCNLSTKQWQAAIDHYENIINNPPTPDDSVFAIIDLGYTYLLMQNSAGRYVAMGSMIEHIPDSDQDFEVKTTNLLKLLPFAKNASQENNDETIDTTVKENRLLQCKPNPTNGITEISFELDIQNHVIINILNNLGSKLKAKELVGEKGNNSIEFNMSDLPPGIYYYALEIDNRIVDIQKLVVVR